MAEREVGLPDDALLTRSSGSHTADKLAILSCYLPAFTRACGQVNAFFVDGFAGPGVNRMKDTGRLVPGSPLIALEAEPPFSKCLFVDWGAKESEALRQRTESYGDRAVVERADVNKELLPLMSKHIPRWAPCLVLLDPEGTELKWTTVEAVAGFRTGQRKAELLILLPTHMGFVRMLPVGSEEATQPELLDEMFGTHEWHDIWKRRRNAWINPQQAVNKYVDLYKEQLRRLGYRVALNREIRTRGKLGRPMYHLVFATDHDAGDRIMDHCFKTCYEAKQQSLLDKNY
jgi:three-Cys-motif partner protein